MKPVSITVQHPDSLNASEILGIINGVVDTDAPVVVSALPVSDATSSKVSIYVTLGELAVGIAAQIASMIQAAHVAKATPPAKTT